MPTSKQDSAAPREFAFRRFYRTICRFENSLSSDGEIELANQIADLLEPYYPFHSPREYILLTLRNLDKMWVTELRGPVHSQLGSWGTGTVVAGQPVEKRESALDGLLEALRKENGGRVNSD